MVARMKPVERGGQRIVALSAQVQTVPCPGCNGDGWLYCELCGGEAMVSSTAANAWRRGLSMQPPMPAGADPVVVSQLRDLVHDFRDVNPHVSIAEFCDRVSEVEQRCTANGLRIERWMATVAVLCDEIDTPDGVEHAVDALTLFASSTERSN